jgi:hypothetical protein
MPRNYHEIDNHDGSEMPTCDLRWAPDCDNIGVYYLIPERACCACFSVCTVCHTREWLAQDGDERLCDECLSRAAEAASERAYEAFHSSSRPQSEAERHALVMAQLEGRR